MYNEEKWDLRFLETASVFAKWSKDPSRKIGAVIVGASGQIISQGYNGFPRGIGDNEERYNDRAQKYKYVVHAESNAIFNAIHNGSALFGTSIYVSGLPICHECAKAVIQVGIKRVVYNTIPADAWKESCELALSMFDEVGIEHKYYSSNGD